MYVCIYIYIYYIFILIHIYIYKNAYICKYTCVYIYISILFLVTSTSPFAHQLLLHQPFRSVPTTVPGPARHQLAQGPGRGVDAAHGQGGLLWGAIGDLTKQHAIEMVFKPSNLTNLISKTVEQTKTKNRGLFRDI